MSRWITLAGRTAPRSAGSRPATVRQVAARSRAVAVAVSAVLVLGACGVEVQDTAEPLPGGALPTVAAPADQPPQARDTPIYFVSGRGLQAVPEALENRSASGVMAALAAGPVVQQSELRTLLVDPLSNEPVLEVIDVTPAGEVVLRRTDAYLQMSATDQLLLVGQVVHSLDEVGLSPVSVIDSQGVPVPLARPDGRQIQGPVTAADYEDLLAD